MSKFYRFNMYMMLLVARVLHPDQLAIHPSNGHGRSGLGYPVDYCYFHGVKLIFIYRQYHLQPFSGKNVSLLLVTGLVLYLALTIPTLRSVWLDIPLRSLGITLLFGTLVFLLRISEDANHLLLMVLRKVGLPLRSGNLP